MVWNPLLYLNLHVAGGPRGQLMVVGAFVAMVAVFAPISYANATPGGGIDATWLGIMTAAQCVFVLLIAPSAIRRAVLRDFQTGMIESHRLSPMSNGRIVLGYMTGGPVQALLLYTASLLMGAYFAARCGTALVGGVMLPGAQLVISGWLALQVLILIFGLLIGSVALLSGIATSGKANIIGIMILIAIFGGWIAVLYVPGLALVLGIITMGAIGEMVTGGTTPSAANMLLTTALLQLLLGSLLLWTAAGKLRRPERALFTLTQSLLLLLLWGTAIVAGLRFMPVLIVSLDGPLSDASGVHAQIVASTFAFALIGLFAISSATLSLLHADRAAALAAASDSDRRAPRRELYVLTPVVVAAATLAIWMLLYEWAPISSDIQAELSAYREPRTWAIVALALTVMCWTDGKLLYIFAARGRRLLFSMLVTILLLRIGPILVEGFAAFMADVIAEREWENWGTLSQLSPAGTLAAIRTPTSALYVGLAVQIGIAVAVTALARGVRRGLSAKTA